MKATPLFVLCVVFNGLAQGEILYREHIFVGHKKPWPEARDYCRQEHSDLSTIADAVENTLLLAQNEDDSWIGLHQDEPDENWYWSDGDDSDFRNWSPVEPNAAGEHCALIGRADGKWYSINCGAGRTFFCYQRKELVLVRERMSWEEALLHCRKEHTDLASLFTDHETAVADNMADDTHAALVWTSLRFLAGEWLWVSESNQARQEFNPGSLPSCPVQNHSCGARRPSDGQWVSVDCEEKLSFFCFRAL